MKTNLDRLTQVSMALFIASALALAFSLVVMGPVLDCATPALWIIYAAGIMTLFTSLTLYAVAVFSRETTWWDVGALTLAGIGLIGGSVLLTRGASNSTMIFHPIIGTMFLGLLALFFAFLCVFRASKY